MSNLIPTKSNLKSKLNFITKFYNNVIMKKIEFFEIENITQ